MTLYLNGTTGISGVDGSAGTPAVQGTDTNTGISFPAADTVAVNTGGSERVRCDSSGRVGIGTTSVNFGAIDHGVHIYGSGAQEGIRLETTNGSGGILEIYAENGGNTLDTRGSGYIRFNNAASEWGRWDSSGRLLVGTSSARSNVDSPGGNSTPFVQIETAAGSYNTGLSIINNSVATYAPVLTLGATNGGSVGSNTIVTNGQYLGTINFVGADGTNLIEGAYIRAEVNGAPGANDMPGSLVFGTTADGASSPTERLRIGNAGGIDVSAIGNADNYLRNTAGQTTASGANLFIDSSSGVLRRSTSSIKYKTDIETLQDSYANEILKCRPVWYRSTSDYDNQQWGYWGFIAEEVAEVDPRLCFYGKNEDGSLEPEGVQYDRFVPHLLNLIKRQQQAIEDLQAKVAALKAQ